MKDIYFEETGSLIPYDNLAIYITEEKQGIFKKPKIDLKITNQSVTYNFTLKNKNVGIRMIRDLRKALYEDNTLIIIKNQSSMIETLNGKDAEVNYFNSILAERLSTDTKKETK